MADSRRDRVQLLGQHGVAQHGVGGVNSALTAAAQLVSHAESRRPLQYESWQDEAWDFYENLGEFNYGVEWFGEAMSRVRLAAAKITPGGDEPEIITEGPIAELITQLANGTDGQAQIMRSLGVQLSVPGDSYFVGREVTQLDYDMGYLLDAEADAYGRAWTVQPVNTMRRRYRGIGSMLRKRQLSRWELQVDDAAWMPLPDETLICRIWDRNEHYPWRAMSPAKAALPIMREIDMYNRYIIATLISRVAMNGMFFIPDEVSFPVNPAYENETDPFIAELLDIMVAAIKNPGSPSAAMPVPLRVPQEYIEAFKHFQFATPLDQKIFEHRESALRRLATTLNLPAEIVTGMGAVNHWCRQKSTKAYTPNGWSDNIQVGDTVLTLDHETGLARWSPVLDIYRAPVVDERMLTVQLTTTHGGRKSSLISTPEHRFPVIRNGERLIVLGHQLQRGDVITRGAIASTPETQTFTDDLVRLVAWYSADGTLTGSEKKPRQIRIGKSWRENPDATARLMSVLTNVFGPARELMPIGIGPAWRMEKQDRGMMIAVLNAAARDVILELVPGKDKIIPRSFVDKLTSAQLDVFLGAWFVSDGRAQVIDHAAGSLQQREAARLDAIEYAAILSGRATRRWTKTSNGFKAGIMHGLSVSPFSTVTVCAVTETTYTGEVWCPVTETGTWLAQEPNGWTDYTGNSGWQLSEDAIKIHVSPKAEIITRCLTVGFMHPMMKSQGLDLVDKDGSRYIVWYDTSELTQRPDRSGSAISLRQMLVISDAAARRETGFDEADAPTDDELEKMVLMQLAINPQTAVPALKELTGLEMEMPQPPAGAPVETPPSGAASEAETPDDPSNDGGTGAAPKTRDNTPPPPDADVTASASFQRDQIVKQTHSVRRRARASVTWG
jgi:hypothetical protein